MNPTLEVADSPGPARGASFVAELSEGKRWTNYFGLDGSLMSPPGTSRRFLHLRYFRFGGERSLVNRMPDECKIGIEVNPKDRAEKADYSWQQRYPARARSGAS